MTYPVGRLPNTGDLSGKFVPFKAGTAFTHGGSDMDLTDPANLVAPCADALYITVSGNLIGRLAGNTDERTYPVTQGQVLLGAFVLLKGTSTADCIPWQSSG